MKKILSIMLLSVCLINKADFSIEDFFFISAEAAKTCRSECKAAKYEFTEEYYKNYERCLIKEITKEYHLATSEQQERFKSEASKLFIRWMETESMAAILVNNKARKHIIGAFIEFWKEQYHNEEWCNLCEEVEQEAGERLDIVEQEKLSKS